MADELLQVDALQVCYGESRVIQRLSLGARAGEIVALMGLNGMGKTTLMKALIGLLPARSGRIRLAERDLGGEPPHERVASGLGYVPQGRLVFPTLTVEENIMTGLQRGERRIPDEIHRMFPVLKEMRRRRAGNLSGGQQQQLAIARALAAGPRLLVLDEPTEGIQPSIIKDIGRVIRMLADTGLPIDGQPRRMAIVLVEQYYDFAEELADRYCVMERGEIVQQGRGADMAAEGARARMSI